MNSRTVRSEQLIAGMVVAQPVLSNSGQVLLEAGTMLTGERIRHLRSWRIAQVDIVDSKQNYLEKPVLSEVYEETLDIISQTFEKVKLFQEVPVDECKDMVENYIEIMLNIPGLIDSLHRVKGHSEHTYRHSLNVSLVAGLLGKWLGYKEQALRDLMLAGLLHDIGKTLLDQELLAKTELSAEEEAAVRMHALQGYQLLASADDVAPEVKMAVLQHHERADGSGYPMGLQAENISEYAKIIAIADLYDAVTGERSGRRKLPPFTAVETILDDMYGKLDPKLCLTFVSNLGQQLSGSLVELSDGRKARAFLVNDVFVARPVVKIIDGETIDLEKRRDLSIVALLDEDTAAVGA
ncbi:MAG: HD-GYP domain-containing protein [Sporomusaceae bacterium]|nr:HD-GYP domain-containing protein [Sporomusaceae bacterium]